jgi:hypothetical protein
MLAGRWAPLVNGALCLSILKHNGKSGTDYVEEATESKCWNSTPFYEYGGLVRP